MKSFNLSSKWNAMQHINEDDLVVVVVVVVYLTLTQYQNFNNPIGLVLSGRLGSWDGLEVDGDNKLKQETVETEK